MPENTLKYHNLFEASSDAIVINNIYKDGSVSKILEANAACSKIFGFTKNELLEKNLFEFEKGFTKEEKYKKMEERKELVLKNKQDDFEMIVTHKDGHDIIVKIKVILIEDAQQPYLMNIIEDITEKKKIEKKLRDSEKRFKIMFENNPIAMFLEDFSLIYEYFDALKTKGVKDLRKFLDESQDEIFNLAKLIKIIDVNKAAIKLYNAKNKDKLLESLDNTFTDLSFKAFKDELIGIWNKQEEGEFEVLTKTLDGEKKDALMNFKKLPAINNNSFHYLITIKDITEKKKIEEAKIRNYSLNALGEMASSVAHDFNNSLQSILGNLELTMYEEGLPLKVLDLLNTMKIATIDASNRVKIVRRFGENKDDNEYRLLDIEELIDDIIVQSRPIWKDDTDKNGISIDIVKKYGKVPQILGSSSELRNVVYNILKNSIESISKDGVITFSTSESKNGVELLIKDTGIGMDYSEKSKVFQPFYTTKGFELGRGLGMSGVYTIIKEHKADIHISSSKNKGTTVKISFPSSIVEKIVPEQLPIKEKKLDKTLSILWVDDEDMIRDIAQRYIELIGHLGSVAKDGIDALNSLDKNKYDLLITDIGMPNMNGWQLIDNVKEKYPNLKIIVVTGWGAIITDIEKTQYNIFATLEKPIQFKDLKKIIDTI